MIALLEKENCTNRNLHRNQFIKFNRKIMDILGQVSQKHEVGEKAFWLNEVFMEPEVSGEEYFYRLRQLCKKICNDNVEKKQEQRGLLVEEIKNTFKNIIVTVIWDYPKSEENSACLKAICLHCSRSNLGVILQIMWKC